MNKELLKTRIKETTGSKAMLDELQRLLNLSANSLVAKTNGRREFKPSEIDAIRREYRLTPEDVIEIFIKQGETQNDI